MAIAVISFSYPILSTISMRSDNGFGIIGKTARGQCEEYTKWTRFLLRNIFYGIDVCETILTLDRMHLIMTMFARPNFP